jgi:hypothetical protein
MGSARWNFLVGLGITICFGAIPFTGPPVPHYVGWIGVFIGLVVMTWPFLRLGTSVKWPFGMMSLDDAARRLYEAAERKGALGVVTYEKSDAAINIYNVKFQLVADPELILCGAEPPSRKILPIPMARRSRIYAPENTSNQLNELTPLDHIAYANVKVTRDSLRKAIAKLPARHNALEILRKRRQPF